VIEAERARALLRAEIEAGVEDPARLRAMLLEAWASRGAAFLVHRRQSELAALEDDLQQRRQKVLGRLRGPRAPCH